MVTTMEQIEAAAMASRRRDAGKHQPECRYPSDIDADCTCEIDGVHMWCTHCGAKFSLPEARSLNGCPKCGTHGIPCSVVDDVQVGINWHELRILVMWAEHWADHISKKPCPEYEDPRSRAEMPEVVRAIARRLQNQYPTRHALTFAGEMAEFQEAIPESTVISSVQPDKSMIPPKIS